MQLMMALLHCKELFLPELAIFPDPPAATLLLSGDMFNCLSLHQNGGTVSFHQLVFCFAAVASASTILHHPTAPFGATVFRLMDFHLQLLHPPGIILLLYA